jgi:hypothetical protein
VRRAALFAIEVLALAFAVDRVFVMYSLEAPEVAALVRAGVTEGSANTHPGARASEPAVLLRQGVPRAALGE